MESAIQKAAYSKFGFDNEIEATIDREKGSIKIQKVLQIVEKVEDPAKEISLKDASLIDKKNKDLKIGDKIYEELPQIDFGRIAAQSAKQVISQKVKEAERTRQYNDFIDKQGQILSGIIKRLEYGNVIIDLGRAEGIIRKEELIPREILKKWNWWPLFPLYPYGKKKTILRELIPDQIWSLEQIQGLYYVAVPIRMTVIKVDNGLMLINPLPPTKELINNENQ